MYENTARKMYANAARPIPIAILRGVETTLPFLAKAAKIPMTIGVNTITKNGLIACKNSGATLSVFMKSLANNENEAPFWWNENQKKIAIPKTANKA